MGKYHELNFGITSTINYMVSRGIGLKKEQMIKQMKTEYLKTHDSLKGFDYKKNDYIRSLKSASAMRQAQKVFVDWTKQNNIKKFELVTRDDLCRYLLDRSEQTKSAWTISRELHFCSKIFYSLLKDNPITKKELQLPSRLQKNVVRGRNGQPKNRPLIIEKNRAQVDMVLATGMRRFSVTRIRYSDFTFVNGRPVSCELLEKGGKLRTTYILPAYQERVREIIEPFRDRSEAIFKSYDKNINSHFYRHTYAEILLKQLVDEHQRRVPYFQNDYRCDYKICKKDRGLTEWRSLPIVPCFLTSSQLGHNRVCILSSYIW